MNVSDLLVETFDRIPGLVHSAVSGLTAADLRWVPSPGANSVGWLVWHLTRIQDDHVADVLGSEQVWITGNWAHRFGLDPDSTETGYGHTAEDVAAVAPHSSKVLVDYYDAVAAQTRELLVGLSVQDLDRIVDPGWDPPVTLGVRLISVANDDLQHVGQAAYVRGLQKRAAS